MLQKDIDKNLVTVNLKILNDIEVFACIFDL